MKKHHRLLLYIPQPRTLKIFGGGFAIAFLALLLFLGWERGPSQYGNIVSLVGSLALVVPPVRQAIRNALFHIALDNENSDPPIQVARQVSEISDLSNVDNDGLKALDSLIAAAKVRAFMMFSWLDVGFYAVGALLLACGFFISIVFAENK